jgi:predicted double-glycine peptidase
MSPTERTGPRAVLAAAALALLSCLHGATQAQPAVVLLPPTEDEPVLDERQLAGTPAWKRAEARAVREERQWLATRFKGIARQKYRYSCGAAALANLLWHGHRMAASEDALLRAIGNDGQTAPLSMADITGMAASTRASLGAYRLTRHQLRQMRQPVIVQFREDLFSLRKDDIEHEVQAGAYGSQSGAHFVVLVAFGERMARVLDPGQGWRDIPADEFVARWTQEGGDAGVVLAVNGLRR